MRRLLRLGALALAGSVASVVAIGAPASAGRHPPPHPPRRGRPTGSTVEVGDQAALSNNDRTANVVLTVTCAVDVAPAPISVSVRQKGAGGSASSGTGYKCTSRPQQVVVPVTAGSGTFHTGDALASVSVTWHSSTVTPHANATDTTSSNTTSFSTLRTILLT